MYIEEFLLFISMFFCFFVIQKVRNESDETSSIEKLDVAVQETENYNCSEKRVIFRIDELRSRINHVACLLITFRSHFVQFIIPSRHRNNRGIIRAN